MKTTNDYSIVFRTFFDNDIDLVDINHTRILQNWHLIDMKTKMI